MKKVIFGSALVISGTILASVSLIGANIASGNLIFSILFLFGVISSIAGIVMGLAGLSENK